MTIMGITMSLNSCPVSSLSGHRTEIVNDFSIRTTIKTTYTLTDRGEVRIMLRSLSSGKITDVISVIIRNKDLNPQDKVWGHGQVQ